MKLYKYAPKLFGQIQIDDTILNNISDFHKKLDEYFKDIPQEDRKLCIFCSGAYGKQLFKQLKSRLVIIDFFCDNSSDKWGYITDGVSCIPPQLLQKYKKNALIVVATKFPNQVVTDLKNLGYKNIITKQQLDPFIEKTPPVKWIDELNVKNIDYSSPDIQILIEKFAETLFDLTVFYQSKLKDKK